MDARVCSKIHKSNYDECHESFVSPGELKEHILYKYIEEKLFKYNFDKFEKRFESLRSLKDHISKQHKQIFKKFESLNSVTKPPDQPSGHKPT